MEHNGAILEKAVRCSNVSISELAQKLDVNRRTVYYWFNQQTVRIDLLYKISRIIGFDFSKEFPNLKNYSLENGLKKKEEFETETDLVFWRDKYLNLLERYNNQLTERQKFSNVGVG